MNLWLVLASHIGSMYTATIIHVSVCSLKEAASSLIDIKAKWQRLAYTTWLFLIGLFTASPADTGCLLPVLFLAAYSAEHNQ